MADYLRNRIAFEIKEGDIEYEDQYREQIGSDETHQLLVPPITPPDEATAPAVLATANCIFVDVAGDDVGGDGSSVSPYRTLDKGITEFFSQATMVIKYIRLNGDYTWVEDVVISKWLEDNIYRSAGTTPIIKRQERTIPAIDDTTGIWVDLKDGDDVDAGTRAAPKLTIQDALDNTTTVKSTVMVLVQDGYQTTIESLYCSYADKRSIIAYVKEETGSELKGGLDLLLEYDVNKTTFNTDDYLTTGFHIQYIVSKWWTNKNIEMICTLGIFAGTGNIAEGTSDYSTIGTTVANDIADYGATGICEWVKQTSTGDFNIYILVISVKDGGNFIRVVRKDLLNTDSGIMTTATTPRAGVYTYLMSDAPYIIDMYNATGNADNSIGFWVCSDVSAPNHSFIYRIESGKDLALSTTFITTLIYETTVALSEIYLFCTGIGEFFFIVSDINKIYFINSDNSITIKETTYEPVLIFKVEDVLYCLFNDCPSSIHSITFDNDGLMIFTYVCSLPICIVNGVVFVDYELYNEVVYLLVYTSAMNYIYSFDGFNIIQIGKDVIGFTNFIRQRPMHVDLLIAYISVFQKVAIFPTSQIKTFNELTVEGVYFNGKDFNVAGITGKVVNNNYCTFINHERYSIYSDEELSVSHCFFDSIKYPILCYGYDDRDINYCLFYDFKTAIEMSWLNHVAYAGTNSTSISKCTFSEGERYAMNVSLNLPGGTSAGEYAIDIEYSIFEALPYAFISYHADQTANLDTCILSYRDASNNIAKTDCLTGVPLFIDKTNNDYRLSRKALGYNYDSLGLEGSGATDIVIGKNYNWVAYTTPTNTDIGAYNIFSPLYRGQIWGLIEFDYQPKSVNTELTTIDYGINTSMNGISKRADGILKNNYDIKFDSNSSINDYHIQKLLKILEQTDLLKFYMNPLPYIEQLEFASDAEYNASIFKEVMNNGEVGVLSGSWALVDGLISTGQALMINTPLIVNKFLVLYELPVFPGTLTKYEYRIISNIANGDLTLEDYYDMGYPSNDTYLCCIAYELVLPNSKNLTISSDPFVGWNIIGKRANKGLGIKLIGGF